MGPRVKGPDLPIRMRDDQRISRSRYEMATEKLQGENAALMSENEKWKVKLEKARKKARTGGISMVFPSNMRSGQKETKGRKLH